MLYTPYAADGKDPGWHDARFHRVIPTIRPPTSGDCWWETSTKYSRNAGMSQDAAACASSPELAAEVSRKPEITDSFVKTRPFERSLLEMSGLIWYLWGTTLLFIASYIHILLWFIVTSLNYHYCFQVIGFEVVLWQERPFSYSRWGTGVTKNINNNGPISMFIFKSAYTPAPARCSKCNAVIINVISYTCVWSITPGNALQE